MREPLASARPAADAPVCPSPQAADLLPPLSPQAAHKAAPVPSGPALDNTPMSNETTTVPTQPAGRDIPRREATVPIANSAVPIITPATTTNAPLKDEPVSPIPQLRLLPKAAVSRKPHNDQPSGNREAPSEDEDERPRPPKRTRYNRVRDSEEVSSHDQTPVRPLGPPTPRTTIEPVEKLIPGQAAFGALPKTRSVGAERPREHASSLAVRARGSSKTDSEQAGRPRSSSPGHPVFRGPHGVPYSICIHCPGQRALRRKLEKLVIVSLNSVKGQWQLTTGWGLWRRRAAQFARSDIHCR